VFWASITVLRELGLNCLSLIPKSDAGIHPLDVEVIDFLEDGNHVYPSCYSFSAAI